MVAAGRAMTERGAKAELAVKAEAEEAAAAKARREEKSFIVLLFFCGRIDTVKNIMTRAVR